MPDQNPKPSTPTPSPNPAPSQTEKPGTHTPTVPNLSRPDSAVRYLAT